MRNKFLLLALFVLMLSNLGCDKIFPKKEEAQENIADVTKNIAPIKSLTERKIDGTVTLYYDNGKIKAERNYQNAKLNGSYRLYYPNGQIKLEGNYKDDKMDGTFRHYDEKGQLRAEEVYQDNLLITRKVINPS